MAVNEDGQRVHVISSSDAAKLTHFGPAEMAAAYVAIVGVFPPGEPAPPLHLHPDTDEAFYLAEGEAIFMLGDREVPARGRDLVFVPRGTAHTVGTPARSRLMGCLSSRRATPSIHSCPLTPLSHSANSGDTPGLLRGHSRTLAQTGGPSRDSLALGNQARQ